MNNCHSTFLKVQHSIRHGIRCTCLVYYALDSITCHFSILWVVVFVCFMYYLRQHRKRRTCVYFIYFSFFHLRCTSHLTLKYMAHVREEYVWFFIIRLIFSSLDLGCMNNMLNKKMIVDLA